MTDTDNQVNPVIDDIVDSSTTEEETTEEVEETEEIEDQDEESEESEEHESDEPEEEESEDDATAESEKTNTQKRFDKITAEKKEAERLLTERTNQLQSFLSEAHRNVPVPVRENYSSDASYEGAVLNYKMSLAKKEDAGRSAQEFVKQTLADRFGSIVKEDRNALVHLKGMPAEFYELLAMSSNPVEIAAAMRDHSTRERILNLPPHLLGSAISQLDRASVPTGKEPAGKKPKKSVKPGGKTYKPIKESSTGKASQSFSKTKVPTGREFLASRGYKKR